MAVTLDWLGCATFRLQVDDFVIFLDGYIDRVPSAPPVGISAAEVDRADAILVGHAHFDHIAGVEVIARNTGARVVCSTGGADSVATGHLGLTEDDRAAVRAENPLGGSAPDPELLAQMQQHIASSLHSDHTGGALAYLIETPYGSIFYHDTSGCWTGVVRDLRPDFAIVAMAGRANIDGEPIQGTTMLGGLPSPATALRKNRWRRCELNSRGSRHAWSCSRLATSKGRRSSTDGVHRHHWHATR